jgi:glycosyltransferase involved in cell wall biosynthesis
MRVIARMNVGGPAVHLGVLSAGLDESRYDSLVVFGALSPGEEDMSDVLAGSATVLVPELGRAVRPLNDLVALAKLVRVVFAFRPHVLHTHTAKAGALGRIAGLVYNVCHPWRRLMVVHTYHGHVFTGYFRPWQHALIRFLERVLGLVTSRVICISSGQAVDVVRRFRIVPARKVQVVPLGMDLRGFLGIDRARDGETFRREVGACHGDVVVGYVGRLVPIKNPSLLIGAFALAVERIDHLRLVIVGGGEMDSCLKEQVQRAGLSGRVTFAGWRRDLASVYAGIDILALTSDNEGTPVSVIEAMASGCAVVATSVGGVPDVVSHPSDGLLVAPRDPVALTEALIQLASDTGRREGLGRAARVSAQRYTSDRLVADIDRLYRSLAGAA